MHSWTAFSFITPTLVLDYLHMLPHLIRNVIPRGCFQLRNCAFEFHSSRINFSRPQTVKSFEMQSNKVAKVRINSSESGKNLDQWYWLILPLLSPPLSSLSPTKKRSWLHGNTTQKQLYIQKVSTKGVRLSCPKATISFITEVYFSHTLTCLTLSLVMVAYSFPQVALNMIVCLADCRNSDVEIVLTGHWAAG